MPWFIPRATVSPPIPSKRVTTSAPFDLPRAHESIAHPAANYRQPWDPEGDVSFCPSFIGSKTSSGKITSQRSQQILSIYSAPSSSRWRTMIAATLASMHCMFSGGEKLRARRPTGLPRPSSRSRRSPSIRRKSGSPGLRAAIARCRGWPGEPHHLPVPSGVACDESRPQPQLRFQAPRRTRSGCQPGSDSYTKKRPLAGPGKELVFLRGCYTIHV